MKKLLILCFVLLSSTAFANLDGQWSGWGEWTFQGSGAHCYTFLSFNETNSSLKRNESVFDCDYATLNILEENWIKDGENLLIDGVVVGSVVGNNYKFFENYSETVTIETLINVEGNHLDYKEIWKASGNDLYVITGRLFRKQN